MDGSAAGVSEAVLPSTPCATADVARLPPPLLPPLPPPPVALLLLPRLPLLPPRFSLRAVLGFVRGRNTPPTLAVSVTCSPPSCRNSCDSDRESGSSKWGEPLPWALLLLLLLLLLRSARLLLDRRPAVDPGRRGDDGSDGSDSAPPDGPPPWSCGPVEDDGSTGASTSEPDADAYEGGATAHAPECRSIRMRLLLAWAPAPVLPPPLL